MGNETDVMVNAEERAQNATARQDRRNRIAGKNRTTKQGGKARGCLANIARRKRDENGTGRWTRLNGKAMQTVRKRRANSAKQKGSRDRTRE